MRKQLAVLLFAAGCSLTVPESAAQKLSVGVKGGVSITDPTWPNDHSKRYIVGPSIEVRLPGNFAVEADALYQRTGNTFIYSMSDLLTGSLTSYNTRERGNMWQFPVLGKYYFRSRQSAWRPFVGTGYTFRTTWFHSSTEISATDPATNQVKTSKFTYDYRGPLDVGAMASAGVRLRAGRIAILPEFRCIRWGSTSYTSRRNQVAFLLGISF